MTTVHDLIRIACSSVHVHRAVPGVPEAVVAGDASDRRRVAIRRTRPSTPTIDPDVFRARVGSAHLVLPKAPGRL
jgi:hypothetical protein